MDFKLIMVFVDEDKTDKVLDASRKAGATGATIITNARGQGLQKTLGIFGLEILNPRDVLLILTEKRRADEVMEAVLAAGQLDESLGTGIAIQIDVDKALGLTEHIKALEKQIPPQQS
ncbi:P-II family nitrogen regulator [Marinospirillum alkaliphilum]|uniref:Nitrogen regulatory protein P-II family n=1 Tax=Marinospirillum alkaliphilum DSM 21637 TaxID=1122209 RepID=A0A1K1UZM9_9GAMM|nr:P-II family nitrogen regulator [Marinospirillum alkaliphilum]SFX17979.1 nitrogen regulatory protein P-II family [Marinospirillum alkaliphilum DSM 21637]